MWTKMIIRVNAFSNLMHRLTPGLKNTIKLKFCFENPIYPFG
ncbi:hypothetical protein SAMN04488101_1141, partial [Pedobacter nyackensis]